MRLGYRFEPASAHYQAMFHVADGALGLPQERVGDWLALPPEQRRSWLELCDLRASAALLLLEQAALRRQELRALDELKRRLLGKGSVTDENAPDREEIRDFLRSGSFLSRPSTLLAAGGYGMPLAGELRNVWEEAQARVERLLKEEAALQAEARRWLPASRQAALAGTEENISLLSQRMRRLHQEQGGLQLQ